MGTQTKTIERAAHLFAALSWLALYPLFFTAVALSHLTLLRLPYFWDEGGYYIPAALDFYHRYALIPHFTNAHPPLPAIVLGTLWHITGFHPLATRLAVCAFAAAGLLAVFRLAQRLLSPAAAIATTLLTACYPIWFAQSTLAHADIFAAAFTLWAFAKYLPLQLDFENSYFETERDLANVRDHHGLNIGREYVLVAVLFSLAALSKETAIVEPATLAATHLFLLALHRRNATLRREHTRWLITLSLPVLPLIAWYAYHRARTGFTFGNPEYLRYNATANLSAKHLLDGLHYRFVHLAWQRNMWLPIVLALACLFLERRRNMASLPRIAIRVIAVLIVANWLAFSVLGGALLTRYLLPVYPLILLLCVATWRSRTSHWPWLAAVTAAAFLSALWLNPPTAFAPEDNLTYRSMIVVHQQAIDYISLHYPDATVLTAWPASTELFEPYLGYTQRSIKVKQIENFNLAEVQKAGEHPEDYDTVLAFTTHYTSPALAHYLLQHPNTRRGQEFSAGRDLQPGEIAAVLGGVIVWKNDLGGEWAAVVRFNRSYEAKAKQ